MTTLLLFLAVVCFLAVYFAPYLVALARKTRHRDLILLATVLLAWTIYGWFLLLAFAAFARREEKEVRQITAVSHVDPTKARVSLEAQVEDKDVPKRVQDFVDAVFETLPRIMDCYIKGDMGVRKRISDWYMSLNLDELKEYITSEEFPDDVCTMRRIGALGRKLVCNNCDQELSVQLAREVSEHKRGSCPHCGMKIVGVL